MKHSSEDMVSMPGGFRALTSWTDEYDISPSRGNNYGAVTVLSIAITIAIVLLYKRFLND